MKFYILVAIYVFGSSAVCEGFVIPSVTDLSQKRFKSSNILSSASQYLSNLGSSSQQGGGESDAKSFTDVKTQYYSLGSPIPAGNYETGSSKVALPNREQKPKDANQYWDNANQLLVQGGSLKTWSFASPSVDSVQLRLWTEGRPLDAAVDLWQGPDNTPQRIRVYLEDGKKRPFSCLMLAPRGPNTVAVRNMGQMEFPFTASVMADVGDETGPMFIPQPVNYKVAPMTIQGGALRTYPFDVNVDSVSVLLRTDGRPLNARIELLQGPNNNKQVIEVYTEDGLDRPFYVVLETPGSGNVVRIVNVATVEFPLTAVVEPYRILESGATSSQAVMGGDSGRSARVDFFR